MEADSPLHVIHDSKFLHFDQRAAVHKSNFFLVLAFFPYSLFTDHEMIFLYRYLCRRPCAR